MVEAAEVEVEMEGGPEDDLPAAGDVPRDSADKTLPVVNLQANLSVMGSIVPPEGTEEEGLHKLWNHLHQISEFQMDVDSPFEKSNREDKFTQPERLDYPNETSRAGHFGRTLGSMVEMAKKLE